MNEIRIFLENNAVGLLALFITPFLAWLFNKRKLFSEVKKTDADASSVIANSSGNLALSWQTFANEMNDQYNNCIERTNGLEKRINSVTDDNDNLQKNQIILQNQNKDLKVYTEKLTDFIQNLLIKMEIINPELVTISKVELEKIKEQFQNIGKING